MSKNLFNAQSGAADQQMVQVSLMGLHGDGPQLTQFFFFFFARLFIFYLLLVETLTPVLRPPASPGLGPPRSAPLAPRHANTHACVLGPLRARTARNHRLRRGWQGADVAIPGCSAI